MKLHLGCGSRIIPGFENLDGDPVPGAHKWWAPKLPFADNSVDYIYSEHFIEHLDKEVAIELFKECHRVLKPGARMRIVTPSLETIIEDFELELWAPHPNKINGKYAEVGWFPKTGSDFFNEAFRSWGHKYIWSNEDLLNEIQRFFEFACFEVYDPKIESRPEYEDCIIEAEK